MKINLKGNTSQETTTGANLVNFFNPTGTYNITYDSTTQIYTTTAITGSWGGFHIYNSNNPIEIPVGTSKYYYSADIRLKSGTYSNSLNYFRAGGTIANVERTSVEIANPNMTSSFQRYIFEVTYVNSGDTATSSADHIAQLKTGADNCVLEVKNVMISSANVSYEPYTNGASPNPDYPQDIHVVSGDNSIEVVGSNLVDFENYTSLGKLTYDSATKVFTSNSLTGNYQGVNIYVNSTPVNIPTGNSTFYYSANIKINSGTYTQKINLFRQGSVYPSLTTNITEISNPVLSSSYQRYIFKVDYNNESGSVIQNTNQYIQLKDNATNVVLSIKNLMISKENITYSPYTEAIYPISLGDIELCKIEDYQDTIVKDNGKWYLNKQIGKVVLNGSEVTWTAKGTGGNNVYVYQWSRGPQDKLNVVNEPICCNYFKQITISQSDAKNVEGIASGKVNEYSIKIGTTASTTVEDFQTWLSTNKPVVYYPLSTPTYTEITDTTLLSQLEALNGAKSYTTQTNISQVNNDNASILNASALSE